jgi:hypothetical protein
MAHVQIMNGGDGLQIWKVAVDILNKQPTRADRRGDIPVWTLGRRTNNPSL